MNLYDLLPNERAEILIALTSHRWKVEQDTEAASIVYNAPLTRYMETRIRTIDGVIKKVMSP